MSEDTTTTFSGSHFDIEANLQCTTVRAIPLKKVEGGRKFRSTLQTLSGFFCPPSDKNGYFSYPHWIFLDDFTPLGQFKKKSLPFSIPLSD